MEVLNVHPKSVVSNNCKMLIIILPASSMTLHKSLMWTETLTGVYSTCNQKNEKNTDVKQVTVLTLLIVTTLLSDHKHQ